MKHAAIAFCLMALVLPACKKDGAIPQADLGHAYFPTDTGRWITYTVDTAWRNDVTGVTGSARYALREKLTNDFTDAEGRPAQRLLRSKLDSASGNWEPKDVWWQARTTANAERAEENQRRIKLIFPPRTGQSWNTNTLNTERPYELAYAEVDVPWAVNGMSFDSTILVKTTYFNNAVEAHTYWERYAKHVGLIYREVDSTNTQYVNGVQKVRGTWYKQVITGSGQ